MEPCQAPFRHGAGRQVPWVLLLLFLSPSSPLPLSYSRSPLARCTDAAGAKRTPDRRRAHESGHGPLPPCSRSAAARAVQPHQARLVSPLAACQDHASVPPHPRSSTRPESRITDRQLMREPNDIATSCVLYHCCPPLPPPPVSPASIINQRHLLKLVLFACISYHLLDSRTGPAPLQAPLRYAAPRHAPLPLTLQAPAAASPPCLFISNC